MVIKNIKRLVFLLALASQAQADPVDEYKALSKVYGQSYMEYLKLSTSAPKQTKVLEDAVQNKQTLLTSKTEELTQVTGDLEKAEDRLNNIKMNRAFLVRAIELAKEKQEQTKTSAKQSSEYSDGEVVTVATLEAKASKLQTEINGLTTQVDGLNSSIAAIEASEPYRQRVSAVSSARSRLRQIDGTISELESSISYLQQQVRNGEYEVSRLEREIDNSEDRLDDVKSAIPRTESEIRRLEWDLQDVRRQSQQNESARRSVKQRIDSLQSEKSRLDPTKDAARIAQLEAEINREQNQLQNLRQEKRQLDSREQQVQFELMRLQSDLRSLESEERNLDSEIDNMERRLSDEERNLSSNRSSLRNKESELSSARSQRDRQARSLRSAQAELADYRQTHIAPLEEQIRGLQAQISSLEKRKGQLLAWRDQIVRQDQNIQKANADIEMSHQLERETTSSIETLRAQTKTIGQDLERLSQELSQAQSSLDKHLEEVRLKQARTLEIESQMEQLKDQIIGSGEL